MKQPKKDHGNKPIKTEKPICYKVDKITYVVEPYYREGTDKTIHDAILNMMARDSEELSL